MKLKRFNLVLTLFISFLMFSIPFTFSLQSQSNLTYDGNGNLITGDGKYREYNEFNQLIRIRNGSIATGQILETYIYHPTQDRILVKKVNTDRVGNDSEYAIIYVNDNFERTHDLIGIREINDTYYVYDDYGIVGEVIMNSTNATSGFTQLRKIFYHNDHLGSTSVITDNISGSVVEETFYDPYGGILSGGNTSRYAYEGKEFSQYADDYDFNFRKYNPKIGVFTQGDAVISNVYDPQSLNRYRFERNNPYKYVDKDGKTGVLFTVSYTKAYYRSYAAGSVGGGFTHNPETNFLEYGFVETFAGGGGYTTGLTEYTVDLTLSPNAKELKDFGGSSTLFGASISLPEYEILFGLERSVSISNPKIKNYIFHFGGSNPGIEYHVANSYTSTQRIGSISLNNQKDYGNYYPTQQNSFRDNAIGDYYKNEYYNNQKNKNTEPFIDFLNNVKEGVKDLFRRIFNK